MQQSYLKYIFVIFIFLLISACANNAQHEDIHTAFIQDIDKVYIDYRSTNVYITSTKEKELKATLFLFDNGPGIVLDKNNKKINIRVKSDIRRLFKFGQKPKLDIQVPSNYSGKIILDGSSGNVVGEALETKNLQLTASSGNVRLDFNHLQGDVDITVTSGNIDFSFNHEQANANIQLKSNSGRRSIDFLLDEHVETKKVTKGRLGNGEYDIDLTTSSGNMSVK